MQRAACSGQSLDLATEPASASTVTQLADVGASRRGAQYISWHPDGSLKVADCCECIVWLRT